MRTASPVRSNRPIRAARRRTTCATRSIRARVRASAAAARRRMKRVRNSTSTCRRCRSTSCGNSAARRRSKPSTRNAYGMPSLPATRLRRRSSSRSANSPARRNSSDPRRPRRSPTTARRSSRSTGKPARCSATPCPSKAAAAGRITRKPRSAMHRSPNRISAPHSAAAPAACPTDGAASCSSRRRCRNRWYPAMAASRRPSGRCRSPSKSRRR